MGQLCIKGLASGGINTNYYCTSKCAHCVYGSSPEWDRKYMSEDTAHMVFEKLKSLDCNLVHFGGGEPFLDIQGLKKVLKAAANSGIEIEYIETNSAWFKDLKSSVELLEDLKLEGVNSLLVSISPFHNEYIPFYKVKGVIEACRKTGMGVFPWIMEFYKELDAFDDSEIHSLDEYCENFGEDYIEKIPYRYWMRFKGRAIETYKKIYSLSRIEDILNDMSKCWELSVVSDFYIDLFGNYIPGCCSGISIPVEDLGKPISKHKYPFLFTLYNEGIRGLLKLASREFGFIPKDKYLSKCHLCLDIRKYLVLDLKLKALELNPVEFYTRV